MVQSDFKNTIDLIKNINGLQLNFNNQNLSFKQYSKNSKHITFTNQSGMDVNIPLEELNNQYKKEVRECLFLFIHYAHFTRKKVWFFIGF